MRRIKGRVKKLSFVGEAYGILTQRGEELLPLNLPESLRRDGLEVELVIESARMASAWMWGETVRVLEVL